MAAITLRPARPDDADALVRICVGTGASGEDATDLLVHHPRLLAELYALPYLALEPDLATVALGDDRSPEGYVLGALDTRAFEAATEERWWPHLRDHHPRDAFPADAFEALLVHLVHEPPVAEDDLVRTHPSHLHIDLLPSLQGRGVGRRLIEHLLTQLADRGSPGVHLGVSAENGRAIAFYRHLGFVPWPDPDAEVPAHGGVTLVRALR